METAAAAPSSAPATTSSSTPNSTAGSSGAEAQSTPSSGAYGSSRATPHVGNDSRTPSEFSSGKAPAQPAPQSPQPLVHVEQKTPAADTQLYDIEIDGRKHQLTLDQLRNIAMMKGAAEKRFREASEMRKEALAFREQLHKDPLSAAKQILGEKFRDAVENLYKREYIDPEAMTAEQRELAELKRWRAQKEEEQKQLQAEQERRQFELETKHHYDQFQQEIIKTLEENGLPRDLSTIKEMAYYMSENLKHGYKAPMSAIVHQVMEGRRALLNQMFNPATGKLTPEQTVRLLPPEVVQAIRLYDMEQLKKLRANGSNGGEAPAPIQMNPNSRRNRENPRNKYYEYMKSLNRSKE